MALLRQLEYESIGIPLSRGGGYSTVIRVKRKSDQAEFAVRKINITSNLIAKKTSKQEVEIAKELEGHPNIAHVYNGFSEIVNGHDFYFIVMDYYPEGSLQAATLERAKSRLPFDEDLILRWIFQLSSVIKYIHDKGYVHGDIKPHNLFFANSKLDLTLADLRVSKNKEERMPEFMAIWKTPEYCSPEFCSQQHQFCSKCDVYSFGATLHQVLSLNSYPMIGPNRDYPAKTRSFYSNELCDFVKWLLTENDRERPSLDEVVDDRLITERATEIAKKINIPTHHSLRPGNDERDVNFVANITSQWIAAIVERPNHNLAFGHKGDLIALSKDGESVLWRSKIETGWTGTGIWHAVVDERRHRLLLSFHNKVDVLNLASVDVYKIDISKWSDVCAPALDDINLELLLQHKKWQFYGMTILPERDVIFTCDWHHEKIGIWALAGFSSLHEEKPLYEINQSQVKEGFKPTRCALLPSNHAINQSSTVYEYMLAVSDWYHDSVYLMKTVFTVGPSGDCWNITAEMIRTIATKGIEVGYVCGPVDVKFETGSEVLVICDQRNKRVQCLIPNKRWPNFRSKAISKSFGSYFSAVTIQNKPNSGVENHQSDRLLVLAGLNNGNIMRCTFNLA